MKDSELQFDRSVHVLYSKTCKKVIQEKIALHYTQEEGEEIWTKVQLQYVDYLKDLRRDLGKEKNAHNGTGGTYDAIAVFAYYVVCKEKTNLRELEEMDESFLLPSFKKLSFVNANKPLFKKLLHKAFMSAQKDVRSGTTMTCM